MIRCDALIVGGGPAGSTCARALVASGWRVIVIDRARFPRDKVCAGWLTPPVFDLLGLDPTDYRAAGLTLQEIHGFRTGVLGGRLIETRYPSIVSYAIRRCEFDNFLLRRSGATILDGTPLASLERRGDVWIVNGDYQTPMVIGAGGHFCPVARFMQGDRDSAQPVVAREVEFRLNGPAGGIDGSAPELFFCRDLEGYGWCVRKGDYLNVGIGRRTPVLFNEHVRDFAAFIRRLHPIEETPGARWRGHAYLAAGAGPRRLAAAGMLLIGDAAGLAYPESGEGIKPAIDSGRRAAGVLIRAGGRTDATALCDYVDGTRREHPPAMALPQFLHAASAAIGRRLLGSSVFTRHIVLEKWFLRA